MSFLFGSPFAFVPLILLCMLSLGTIMRALRVPARVARRPCCGRCGHECAEPLTERCPECGERYAHVGIATRALAARLRGGMLSALIAWTMLCAVAGMAMWLAAERNASRATAAGMSVTKIVSSSFMLTASEPMDTPFSLVARREQTSTDNNPDGDIIDFELGNVRAKKYAKAHIDIRAATFVVQATGESSGRSGGDFAIEDAAELFAKAGFNQDDEAIRHSMESLVAIVRSTMTDPEFLVQAGITLPANLKPGELRVRSDGSDTRSFRVPAPPLSPWSFTWFKTGCTGLVAACVCGYWFIRQRHLHLLRGHEQSE